MENVVRPAYSGLDRDVEVDVSFSTQVNVVLLLGLHVELYFF